MRYFVELGYNGFKYHGWQRQPKVTTVQEVIEGCMSNALGQKITCIGCGRTDAKVHASQFFFHFDFRVIIDFDLTFRLNKMLPDDISIYNIFPVEGNPHAQFSAASRTYNYFIHTFKDPYLSELSALYTSKLDIDKMAKAVSSIPSYNDFSGTCRCPSRHSSTICDVQSACLYTIPETNMFRFEITANRFLQGMVRLLAQRLIDVGTGELSIEEFELYLSNRKAPKKVKTAHPQGLYLSKVTYPFTIPNLNNQNSKFHFLMNNLNWLKV